MKMTYCESCGKEVKKDSNILRQFQQKLDKFEKSIKNHIQNIENDKDFIYPVEDEGYNTKYISHVSASLNSLKSYVNSEVSSLDSLIKRVK